MDPRNSGSSKHKYQPVPKDFLKLVQETFQEKYAEFLADKTLIVDGAIYPDELILAIGLRNKDEKVRQVNFESSLDYRVDYEADENHGVLEKIHLSIDALDAMFAEYVEAGGDLEMPTLWTAFEFEDTKIYLKSSKDNMELDKMADEFLREHDRETPPESNLH